MFNPRTGAVFAQTNDAAANAVVAFARAEHGTLSRLDTHSTGGLGNGTPHLLGEQLDLLSAATGAALIASAVLSVLAYPLVALGLLRDATTPANGAALSA